ncbi:MAG: MmcQ/YjbR family DNA-binding protein [Alphaproteobacteria bacterium]|nr:MmcQ/YjbR family DNA-binding protein [Alphaproteobacteria bacterium]
MLSVAAFRKLALSMPDALEAPHFELASFRAGGKIFSTLSEKDGRAMVKLTPEQQEMMTGAEPKMFQRIPNAWGDKGATWLHLKFVDARTAESAIKTAHANLLTKAPARKAKGR